MRKEFTVSRRGALASLIAIPFITATMDAQAFTTTVTHTVYNKNGLAVELSDELLQDLKAVYSIEKETVESWFSTWEADSFMLSRKENDPEKFIVRPHSKFGLTTDQEFEVDFLDVLNDEAIDEESEMLVTQYNMMLREYNKYVQENKLQ